jgi:hypothetical protein
MAAFCCACCEGQLLTRSGHGVDHEHATGRRFLLTLTCSPKFILEHPIPRRRCEVSMTESNEVCEVLSDLRAAGHDDHTIVVLLLELIPDATPSSGHGHRQLLARGRSGESAAIELNKGGKIKRVGIATKLKSRFKEIVGLAAAQNPAKVTSTTLFGYRPLEKYYRVDDWIQLRPADTKVHDQTLTQASLSLLDDGRPHPFVLETIYASAPTLPFLEAHRQLIALQEAKWLASAFLELPVFQPSAAFAFILTPQYETALATCTAPYLQSPSIDAFSDVSALQALNPTDRAGYFRRLGIGTNEFCVPDMHELKLEFNQLETEDRARFLRACANLWDSANPAQSVGWRIVAAISAIESLLPDCDKCGACGSHVGITKSFKAFVRRFVPACEDVLQIYEALYPLRSKIAHGAWHPDVDQPMFGLHARNPRLDKHASWGAAKAGAIGWLAARGNSSKWWQV